MGRAHEVRAKKMAATSAAKSALYMRASKEIYMAAKSGEPDPNSNLALRAVLEKYKGQGVTKEVIERAINKAKGGEVTAYEAGRYEGFGPGSSAIIVDTLTDNVRRAYDSVRMCFTKKGGHLGTPGSVSYNFNEIGLITYQGNNVDEATEALIMGDVNVEDVALEDDMVVVKVDKQDLMKAKEILNSLGIEEFAECEITFLPNDYVELEGEDARKFNDLMDLLDDCEDVQNVYHNVIIKE